MPTNFVKQWLPFCPGGGVVQAIGEQLISLTSALFGGGIESAIFGFGTWCTLSKLCINGCVDHDISTPIPPCILTSAARDG
jgi:hypothetical protein